MLREKIIKVYIEGAEGKKFVRSSKKKIVR